MRCLPGPTGKVLTLAYSPDGRSLAGGGVEGVLCLWDLTAGRERARLVPPGPWHQEPITAVAFLLDGAVLASVSERRQWSEFGVVRLWDAHTGQVLHTLPGYIETGGYPEDERDGYYVRFAGLAFDPRTQLLATGSSDRSVKLWELFPSAPAAGGGGSMASRKRVPFWGHEQPVLCVAFSPDGRVLVSGSGDRTLRLWDVARGGLVGATLKRRTAVKRVAFSPDGRLLAAAAGWRVYLWEVNNGPAGRTLAERWTLRGHQETVTCLAFSADGRTLATGAWDRTIRFWDTTTGRQLCSFHWDIGRIHALALAPDGMTAAAAGDKPEVLLWDLDELSYG